MCVCVCVWGRVLFCLLGLFLSRELYSNKTFSVFIQTQKCLKGFYCRILKCLQGIPGRLGVNSSSHFDDQSAATTLCNIISCIDFKLSQPKAQFSFSNHFRPQTHVSSDLKFCDFKCWLEWMHSRLFIKLQIKLCFWRKMMNHTSHHALFEG